MGRFAALALILIVNFPLAAAAGDLESEIDTLEGQASVGTIAPVQLERLAEIYFLTSRCTDVRRVLKGRRATPRISQLLCACGDVCKGPSEVAKMTAFRGLLAKGVRWNDRRVQAAWKQVSSMPEARYWALKHLTATPAAFRDAGLVSVRQELEKELDSLEVRP